MKDDHILFPFPLSNSPVTLSNAYHPLLTLFLIFNRSLSPASVAHISWCGAVHRSMEKLPAATLSKENDSPSLCYYQLSVAPQ